ncbi:RNA polymerase sigma factor [Niastella sp. OAS944]|uniref:RNA polymerase sigma factor n=1 Tax=Niastella sp. OAS944 TaxID=2664089 RepID=UPI003497DDEC|nr:RNA polymerase sigma-70 factor (ECF subfamily) [Chitinophagaceae bacterium OAS944]
MKQLSNELLVSFNAGNANAFQIVFDHFRMRIFYFVKKLVNDQQVAEEITADTFVKLHQQERYFSSFDKIQAFLFITAKNGSFDLLKSRKRGYALEKEYMLLNGDEVEIPVFPDTNIEADVLQHIYDEIEKLPHRAKIVFKLFYLEGLSLAEIAGLMGISAQTVANQKGTALRMLRMKVLDIRALVIFLILWQSKNLLGGN